MGVDNPKWIQDVIDDGLPPVPKDQREIPPTIGQVLAVGPDRNRKIGSLQHRGETEPVHQPARVEIVGALDKRTGMIVFRAASNTGLIFPSDLPEVSLEEAEAFNTAEVQRSLPTARKGGAARTHWSIFSHS